MEIGSLSSSTASALVASNQSQARLRQPEQDKKAQEAPPPQQPQQTEVANRTQQAQTAQPVNENEASERNRSATEQARPTVNANGQTVGTRVNTTA